MNALTLAGIVSAFALVGLIYALLQHDRAVKGFERAGYAIIACSLLAIGGYQLAGITGAERLSKDGYMLMQIIGRVGVLFIVWAALHKHLDVVHTTTGMQGEQGERGERGITGRDGRDATGITGRDGRDGRDA